ncbi:MAG: hypothetical protein JWO30_1269 [Fibrobacteres bacterium]|nr:hypothetical protein [Fibrobacterota bacterium]
MRNSGGEMVLNAKDGFSALEILVALIVVSVLTALCIKPVTGLLQRIKIQNSADGIKHLILNARMRAVANPSRHCGVVFRSHTSSAINDSVFAFLEGAPQDYLYTAAKDEVYGAPFVVDKKYKLSSVIPMGSPTVIVFRGDGSANASAKFILTLGGNQDTVSVLASTGKVKVVVK